MSDYTRIYERACKYANRKAAERDETDNWDVVYHASRFLDQYRRCFDHAFLHFGIESVSIDDADRSMHYVNMGDTYRETVVCENGVCFVSTWGDWYETAERTYCENENKIRCAYCSDFSDFNYGVDDTDSVECESCGHYVDGGNVPAIGSQLNDCTELRDIDSDMLWADNERIATHATKSRYTTIVIRLQYTEYYSSEWANDCGKYHVEVLAVTPGIVRKAERESLLSSTGHTQADWDSWDEHQRCEVCIDYGTFATLWQKTGNNANKLLIEAENQRKAMHLLIGFKLDAPQNAIGTTGWDVMRGNILGGLKGSE